ncbi:MAG: hypothetical protein RI973_2313 [Bacteroidota bacterium]|jgi:hypothetical protein
MKSAAFLPLALLLSCLFACGEPAATFTEPQPAGNDNLPGFPGRIQGRYLSLEDSSMLEVTRQTIRRIYDLDLEIHVDSLDSSLVLSGDTLLNRETGEKNPVTRQGDVLLAHYHHEDTLFSLDPDHLLRKSKGNFFLNTRHDTHSWEVRKLELEKGRLSISSIHGEEDLGKLKEISESARDTVAPYQFTMSKKQFNEFVRKEGFGYTETFARIR